MLVRRHHSYSPVLHMHSAHGMHTSSTGTAPRTAVILPILLTRPLETLVIQSGTPSARQAPSNRTLRRQIAVSLIQSLHGENSTSLCRLMVFVHHHAYSPILNMHSAYGMHTSSTGTAPRAAVTSTLDKDVSSEGDRASASTIA